MPRDPGTGKFTKAAAELLPEPQPVVAEPVEEAPTVDLPWYWAPAWFEDDGVTPRVPSLEEITRLPFPARDVAARQLFRIDIVERSEPTLPQA